MFPSSVRETLLGWTGSFYGKEVQDCLESGSSLHFLDCLED